MIQRKCYFICFALCQRKTKSFLPCYKQKKTI